MENARSTHWTTAFQPYSKRYVVSTRQPFVNVEDGQIQRRPMFLNGSSSEEELSEKIRTPSGSFIPKTVKSITDYFSKQEESKKSITSQALSAKCRFKAGTEINQPRRNTKKVSRKTVRKLKGQAQKLALKRGSVAPIITAINNEQLIGQKQLSSESEWESNDTDQSSSVEVNLIQSEHEKQEEDVFLFHLANQLSHKQFDMASQDQHQRKVNLSPQTVINMGELENDNCEERAAIKEGPPEMSTIEKKVQQVSMDCEDSTAANPSVMSILSIKEMFEEIRKEMKIDMLKIQTQMDELKQQKPREVSNRIIEKCKEEFDKIVEHSMSNQAGEVEKLKQDLKHYKYRNRALTDTVDRMAIEMAELRNRLDNVELSTCRNAITIVGLHLDNQEKIENIREIESFIAENIGVHICVEDFYRSGNQDPRLIVVYLQSMQQKRDVLHFKSYLKGFKNRNGRPVFINDFIPANVQEKKKRDRDIFTISDSLPTPTEVSYIKGRLTVRGQPYVQKVTPPSPKDIVDISPQDLKRVLDMKIQHGGTVSQEGSIFDGYTAAVATHKEVRDLYLKVRLMHPQARHVVCAYNIKGDPIYNQDFCDDGEHSAGRAILNSLLNWNMDNRVVFVTRVYGGTKMGAGRFECYKDASKMAIQALPWNEKLSITQKIPEDQRDPSPPSKDPELTSVKRPASSPVIRGGSNKRLNRGQTRRGYGANRVNRTRNRNPGTFGRGNSSQQQMLNNIRGAYTSTQRTGGRGSRNAWNDSGHLHSWSQQNNEDYYGSQNSLN